MMELLVSRTASPLGEIVTVHAGTAMCALGFADHWDRLRGDLQRRIPAATFLEGPCPQTTRDALEAYFAGDLDALADVELHLVGTPFQRSVWETLRTIAPGATASYGELAARVGRPHAARAIGAANGANPISLVVPCHRVIRSDGSLCGYGGGTDRKRWLLAHESTQA